MTHAVAEVNKWAVLSLCCLALKIRPRDIDENARGYGVNRPLAARAAAVTILRDRMRWTIQDIAWWMGWDRSNVRKWLEDARAGLYDRACGEGRTLRDVIESVWNDPRITDERYEKLHWTA